MLVNLLENQTTPAADPASGIWTWVIFGVLIVALIVMMIMSSRRSKKQQEEAEQRINAVKPGNKVKTIGGICGIVVEVDVSENTFVLETGSETSGKCYVKFDRNAIYETDAVIETEQENAPEELIEPFAETEQQPVEQQPAEPAETVETVAPAADAPVVQEVQEPAAEAQSEQSAADEGTSAKPKRGGRRSKKSS